MRRCCRSAPHEGTALCCHHRAHVDGPGDLGPRLPQATLEVKVYRRLSDAEFRLIQKEGKAFAEARDSQGLVVSPRDEGEGYFEVWADGEPVMMVDNSSMQLVLVAVAGHSAERVPKLQDLQQQWRIRAGTDWERRS